MRPDAAVATNAASVASQPLQTNKSIAKMSIEKITKTDAEWRKLLTPDQYRVARQKGTERAFTGQFWNNHEAGVYRCIGCDLDLFGSETVRFRHRLAELSHADRRASCRNRRGQHAIHAPHRSALRALRFASRPRL